MKDSMKFEIEERHPVIMRSTRDDAEVDKTVLCAYAPADVVVVIDRQTPSSTRGGRDEWILSAKSDNKDAVVVMIAVDIGAMSRRIHRFWMREIRLDGTRPSPDRMTYVSDNIIYELRTRKYRTDKYNFIMNSGQVPRDPFIGGVPDKYVGNRMEYMFKSFAKDGILSLANLLSPYELSTVLNIPLDRAYEVQDGTSKINLESALTIIETLGYLMSTGHNDDGYPMVVITKNTEPVYIKQERTNN